MQRTDESGDMVPSSEESELRKEAVAWVIRLQNDGPSPEDRRAFESWHAQSPAHALMFQKVSSVWDSPDLRQAAVAVAKAEPSLFKRETVWRRRSMLAAACVIVLAMVAAQFEVAMRWQADYWTGVGERRAVELPDRSIATLNTQSAIATSFDDTARRVRLLKGEAFFNVRYDSDRPFIVESADTATRATGTAFVVRAEPGGDQVTVIEGAVAVDAIGAGREAIPPAIVTSGSSIRKEQGRLGHPYAVDVSAVSAWIRGRLVVNGVPFAQVIDELRRYYPGTIVLWNRAIGEMLVTGTYDLADPAKALSLLTQTLPIQKVGLTDRVVILY